MNNVDVSSAPSAKPTVPRFDTIQYRTSPYIAIRTEYEYEYGYEYEYRTTNDTVVYILNLHTNQPHTNLHTNGHYIHFYIQIALCQNYARLCSIMLVGQAVGMQLEFRAVRERQTMVAPWSPALLNLRRRRRLATVTCVKQTHP